MQIVTKNRIPLTVSVLATGLVLGGVGPSMAQSVLFTNWSTIGTGTAVTSVPAVGAAVNRPYATGDSYYINSAGTTDNSVKDGGTGGADIRLSVAGNGIRLISNQNAIVNTSNDVYTFYTNIIDQASGQSGYLYSTFILNTHFLKGSSLTGATFGTFGSIKNGVLGNNTLTLGNNVYSASNFSFTPPSAPPSAGGSSQIDGAFSEHIVAFAGAVPEPGVITLAIGVGVNGTVFGLRRRKSMSR